MQLKKEMNNQNSLFPPQKWRIRIKRSFSTADEIKPEKRDVIIDFRGKCEHASRVLLCTAAPSSSPRFPADTSFLPCPPVAQSSHRAQSCRSAEIHPLMLGAEERSAAGVGGCLHHSLESHRW